MKRQADMRGISLIEGLVAVVILAVGLLALFSFQAGVLRSGADAKTRTEAMQLASSRLGELRDMATQSSVYANRTAFFTELAKEAGVAPWPDAANRRFWVSTCVDGPEAGPLVRVRVSWTDSAILCSTASPTANQLVDASAEIGLKNLAAGVLLAETTPGGGTVKAPTGEAQYGLGRTNVAGLSYGRDQMGNPNADKGKVMSDNGDGTLIVRSTDGNYQLLDASGTILIEAPSPLGIISGNVYVPASMSIERDYIKVGAPDVSWCVTQPFDQLLAADGSAVYDRIPYNCYFGAGWYGAIGPFVFEPDPNFEFDPEDTNPTFIRSEFKTGDNVCVGDDGAPMTAYSNSRHPQLSTIRTYRGYKALTTSDGTPRLDAQGRALFGSSGIVHEKEEDVGSYKSLFARADHDFVLARINGQAVDTDCLPPLQAGNAIAADFFSTDLNPPDDGNPGKFYCLTPTCPSPLPTDTGQSVNSTPITLAGRFLLNGSDVGIPAATVLVNDSIACSVTAAEGATQYSCTVSILEGGSWTGYVTATVPTGYTLLSARKDFTAITQNQVWDFEVQTVTAQSRTISGYIALSGQGVNSFGGLTSSPAGDCQPTPQTTGTNYVQGPFTCTYADLPAGSVTLTVQTEYQLCGSTNKSTTVTVPTSGDVSDVKLCIGKNSGACNQCP
jgi:Tfp pilus assembly protein PilV